MSAAAFWPNSGVKPLRRSAVAALLVLAAALAGAVLAPSSEAAGAQLCQPGQFCAWSETQFGGRSHSAALDVSVFGGLGGQGLLDELLSGAAGAMTGFSYPEALIACVRAWQTDGYEAARDALLPYLPLINFEQQARIALTAAELAGRPMRLYSPELRDGIVGRCHRDDQIRNRDAHQRRS